MYQNYEELLARLADDLYQQRENWQANAFRERRLGWIDSQPRLAMALDSLSDDELFKLEHNSYALVEYLKTYVPGLKALTELANALPEQSSPLPELSSQLRFFSKHIPGRKWQQIQCFSHSVAIQSSEVVDWCCGKGHLGRYLADNHKVAVTGVEWDEALVAEGNKLSVGLSSGSMRLECWDVLSSQFDQAGPLVGHVVALHACGDLHRRLLQRAADEPLQGLSLAPCCYQKTHADQYQFLSVAGQKALLCLQRQDLHTIVQEAVTAPESVREKRIALQRWRLGFDLIQRELRGIDSYLNTPSLPQSALKLGFEGFCRLLAERKGIQLPQCLEWDFYEAEGRRIFAQARRRDLLRLAYRRPLELVLLLDQAAFLQEKQYRVELIQFCPHALSPRNLLINAWRD